MRREEGKNIYEKRRKEEDIYEIAYPPEMKQHCKMSS